MKFLILKLTPPFEVRTGEIDTAYFTERFCDLQQILYSYRIDGLNPIDGNIKTMLEE